MAATEWWHVLVGSISGGALSIAGSALATWWAHKNTSSRENDLRRHQLRIRVMDFNAKTLFEVQDAMTRFQEIALDEWNLNRLKAPVEECNAASFKTRGARFSVLKFHVRLKDKEVKELISKYIQAVEFDYSYQPAGTPRPAGLETEGIAFHEANERIGEILEGIYREEAAP